MRRIHVVEVLSQRATRHLASTVFPQKSGRHILVQRTVSCFETEDDSQHCHFDRRRGVRSVVDVLGSVECEYPLYLIHSSQRNSPFVPLADDTGWRTHCCHILAALANPRYRLWRQQPCPPYHKRRLGLSRLATHMSRAQHICVRGAR